MPANAPDPTRRNERARRAILEASLALTGECGYANVTVEAIARHAGVGKQTIYRWWPSKGAVVLEAVIESLDPVVAYPDTGDLVDDLRTQLTAIVRLIMTTDFGTAYAGLLAAGQSDSTLLAGLFEKIVEPNIQAFGDRIALAQQQGEFPPDADVPTLRDLLYGVIEYRLLHSMPIEPRHIDAVLRITFDGVR